MGRENYDKKGLFPRVQEAREALRQKAMETWQKYMTLADTAIAAGDFETAEKVMRYVLDHMPADPDGTRLLDPSIDKAPDKKQLEGPKVQIGVMIGGVNSPKPALAPVVIDVKDEDEQSD